MDNQILKFSRRQSLAGLSFLGLSGLLLPPAYAQKKSHQTTGVGLSDKPAIRDEDIFTFALNLEYMEAEFYLRATTGKGIADADAGSDAASVIGGHEAKFENKAIREFVEELAENELAHVRFYRKTLGRSAISRPAIDFEAGFKAAAQAAGLPADFDPFADDMSVLLGGMLFEDVGVTAYAGAAPLLKNKEFVEAAAGILAVEAYHMGMARSQLYLMGEKAWTAANAISDARDQVDGPDDKDQGIRVNGKANVVPSTPDAIAFRRTPQEVLHIVYLTDKQGVSKGGFYPSGMNGALKTT
ncbi:MULTISPECIES: ferritin-like domain-containing protein [unclassified Bradyrhizobium]|uniref:ferritin-like domain-containing protein n=1 Tax=unclassified Bradyrhizobium TaxID=2631580 RepID=UPI0021110C35|nr:MULTISPECIES: ferritin-like domain-containing protein [unclassified Bradyrhizobium]MCK1714644.1 ferritin-like domain-containing protein [Bradyrhizobium sp. 143]MCK1730041.1 ferritin-like domain-containing protein [Bradyrhizobium sp. 142]